MLMLLLVSTFWLTRNPLVLPLYLFVLTMTTDQSDKDWWNSTEVSAYWRLWNLPVHYWLVRHLYFPCVRHNIPKTVATLIVFFFSAVMHEVIISVPFRKFHDVVQNHEPQLIVMRISNTTTCFCNCKFLVTN
jgi:MBOAT, membrane-bound O-acyltransferase family